MRELFKKLLRVLAKRVINRYQPVVIGVTGSVGKTTTKEAIAGILAKTFKIRKSEKNYNDAIGIPMTVLGIQPLEGPGISERVRLTDELIGALWLAFGWPKLKYPEILVLELGADKPGDIDYLVDIVKPQVGVVTAVGDIPVHVEFYSSPQAVAREKAKLVKSLPTDDGLAVLNSDDPIVADMSQNSKCNVITYGFSNKADVWISDVAYFVSEKSTHVGGLSFKLHRGDAFIPIRINDMIAPHQIYALMAAAIVGLHLGVNMVDIATDFEQIRFPAGRMQLIAGKNNTIIIDDSYNASPLSTHGALEAMQGFTKAKRRLDRKRHRRVAILGDMAELGRYTETAHRAIGDLAAQNADVVIGVGNSAVFIVENARKELGEKRVAYFATSHDAAQALEGIIKEKDIILVKGSQSRRMEFIVKALMLEPKKAKELLVRQTERWS